MPKIFVLRHQLAEQQARLTGDVKTRLSPLEEEVKYNIRIYESASISTSTETKISTVYGAPLGQNILIIIEFLYGFNTYLCSS